MSHIVTVCVCVVSVSEWECSAADLKASPGLSTDCVTQPAPLGPHSNSTRNPSADRTSELVLCTLRSNSVFKKATSRWIYSHILGQIMFFLKLYLIRISLANFNYILYASLLMVTQGRAVWWLSTVQPWPLTGAPVASAWASEDLTGP